MPDSNSTNLGLLLMATGGDTNAWGANLNTSVITALDNLLGSKLSLSVAGNSNVTLNSSQSQNLYFSFTGTLTGNINVIFPASAGRIFVVNNATSGSFTLTVVPSGGTGFLVTQGSTQAILIDPGTNTAQALQNDILPLEVTLASATTTNLGATGTNVVAISGTTTITSFGSSATTAECLYFIRFTGALTLTYNATSLILPGGVNVTTAAGDCAIAKYEGSGNWRVISYTPAAGFGSGTVQVGSSGQIATYSASTAVVGGAGALPNGITATAQTAGDTSGKVVPYSAFTQGANGASMVLLQTITASNQANVSFTSIPSGYDHYEIRITIGVPVSTADLELQVSTNNASSWISSGYNWAGWETNVSGLTGAHGTNGDTQYTVIYGQVLSTGFSGLIRLMGLSSSSAFFSHQMYYFNGAYVQNSGGCQQNTSGPFNALRLYMSTGNISSGKFSLYGIRSS